jgi:hypothetical protein
MRLALSLVFEGNRRRFEIRRRSGGILDFDTVNAVWWRRPQHFNPPAGMDPAHQRFAVSEATTAFQGLYQSLDAFWVNIPANDAVASHKPYQLAAAQQIGLDIPPTLMTNDVEEAHVFWPSIRRRSDLQAARRDARDVARDTSATAGGRRTGRRDRACAGDLPTPRACRGGPARHRDRRRAVRRRYRCAELTQTVWKHCLQRRRLINQLQLLSEFSERQFDGERFVPTRSCSS